MDCREIFGISIKKYLRNELLASRESINLSQEKMAEKLFIDLRSYADLENGKNKLSLVSFIIYCLRSRRTGASFCRIGKIASDGGKRYFKLTLPSNGSV